MNKIPAQRPVKESIREINDDTWLVGDDLRLSRQAQPLPGRPSWRDGKGSYFVLVKTAAPLPDSRPLSEAAPLEKVYDAGDVSAVWRAGEAFIKVRQVTMPAATREHVALDHLHKRGPFSFSIPEVYHHSESDGRYYIVLSQLPGQTLHNAWPGLDEETKDQFVSRIADICEELAVWTGPSLSGVDGHHLSDLFLGKIGDENCEPQHLMANCEEVGMDCSSLHFYHCDLGPGNIIVDPASGSIGIIDWEVAGFVPREWIRTKFHICSGMDLEYDDFDKRVDWRRRVARRLAHMGYPEVVDKCSAWWNSD